MENRTSEREKPALSPEPLSEPIGEEILRELFGDNADFVLRSVRSGGGCRIFLAYFEGLTSGEMITEQIIKPLTDPMRFRRKSEPYTAERVLSGAVYSSSVQKEEKMERLIGELLAGKCAIIFPKMHLAITADTRSGENRSVDLPKEEKVVKGSKDAFIESMRTNTSLVRRKIRNRDLKIIEMQVGSETGTKVSLVYIRHVTSEALVESVRKKLEALSTEGALMAETIQQGLSDEPNSLFPQVLYTERPDKFALNLLEGRVGVIADGLPIGFLLPGTFAQLIKTPEDLSAHPKAATCLLLLRYGALLMSLLLPGFFVALAMYHQEMIPLELLQSMIEAKQAVPFPVAMEVLGMLVSFEILLEAGLRLPNPIGDTVSIIGALIVGQSAVEARVVSPVVIIVIAAAGLAGYTIPNQDLGTAVRIFRFLMTFCAVAAGIVGLFLGAATLAMYLCSLESCGVAYLTPFVDEKSGWEGLISRSPVGRSMREPALKRRKKD